MGLQLYSLRAQFAKDVPGSMAVVEKWKITDVEAAGLYNLSAEQFRKELDEHHLHASGAHFQWDRFSDDLDGVIRDAKALGCEYVTLPWVPHNGDFTEKDAAQRDREVQRVGPQVRRRGAEVHLPRRTATSSARTRAAPSST